MIGDHVGGRLAVAATTPNAFARSAVCVLLMTATARGPTAAVGATETFATKLVADSTVVEFTVTPAPKVARVLPATNAVFGDPVIRTLMLLAPTAAELTSGNWISMISSDLPALVSPVAVLTTRSAAVPTGSPAGTATVRRRKPVATLSVATAVAVALMAGPDGGVNVTTLFAAVALKPVPVIETVTDGDAPMGLTVARVPP